MTVVELNGIVNGGNRVASSQDNNLVKFSVITLSNDNDDICHNAIENDAFEAQTRLQESNDQTDFGHLEVSMAADDGVASDQNPRHKQTDVLYTVNQSPAIGLCILLGFQVTRKFDQILVFNVHLFIFSSVKR